MGLFDLMKPKSKETEEARSALDAAGDQEPDEGAVHRLVQMLLDVGLDGRGPIDSATQVAEEALREEGSAEKAVKAVARSGMVGGGIGGFVTGVGGFVTMPVALPVNLAEFYIQATRMVGAIANLRGYDLTDQRVRTAVLLTLIGSKSEDVLKKAGISTASGRVTAFALKGLPPGALMMVNKGVGFRLARGVGQKALSRLGRGVPLAGGVVGGGLDGWMMKRIADHAMKEFPQVTADTDGTGGTDGAPAA